MVEWEWEGEAPKGGPRIMSVGLGVLVRIEGEEERGSVEKGLCGFFHRIVKKKNNQKTNGIHKHIKDSINK